MPRLLLVSFVALLLSGAAVAAGPASVAWASFQDPAEHAFTMQVPKGWAVRGGLYRMGLLDPRLMVDMTSPDGAINIRIGDASLPPFALPTPLMMRLGFHEGSPYTPGRGIREVVANYRPGEKFADLYGQLRFGPMCRSLEPKQIKAEPLPPLPTQGGPMQQSHAAGDVLYKCETAAGTKIAFVYARTMLSGDPRSGLGGVWSAADLFSFIAPEAQASATMSMLVHIIHAFEPNPQWVQQQIQIAGASAQQTMADFKRNMEQQHAAFERQQSEFARSNQTWDDIIRGVTLTKDPQTGEQREVWSGANSHHWINATGTVIDTPSSLSPGSQWRELQNQSR